MCVLYLSLNIKNNDNNVKGRLRLHIDFWKSIGAYENIIDTIYNGYKIPFIETPSPIFFKNNKSAIQNSKFVEEAILDLLTSGRIKEYYMPPLVVNPITVLENSCGKKRLILDLRYINQFVWKDRFKLDDWKTMMQYAKKGGYIFNFDLKSGYHYLDLFQSHQP